LNLSLCVIAYNSFLEDNLENLVQKISKRLKQVRKERGWSLDMTSQKTGVSKAMLGQIERCESSPTISTLWKIASGCDVSFSSFVEEPSSSENELTIRRGSLEKLHPQDNKILVLPLFSYDSALGFEAFIIELLPGCEHMSPPHQVGVHEHIIVTSGQIEVFAGGVWHTLKQNEGMKFNADQAHGYRNLSHKKAVFHDIIHYKGAKR